METNGQLAWYLAGEALDLLKSWVDLSEIRKSNGAWDSVVYEDLAKHLKDQLDKYRPE